MSKFKFPFEPFRLRLRERKLKIRFFFCLKAKLIQLKFFIALKCEMSSSGWSWSGIDSATCAQSLRIHIHVRLLSRQLFFLFDYQSTSQAKDCGRSESNWLKSSAGYCTISQTLLLALLRKNFLQLFFFFSAFYPHCSLHLCSIDGWIFE